MSAQTTLSEFNLKDEDKQRLLNEIIDFFENDRDEQIGIIAAENVFEFFLNTLGKTIYNKALDDIKIWFEKRMEITESDFYTMYKN